MCPPPYKIPTIILDQSDCPLYIETPSIFKISNYKKETTIFWCILYLKFTEFQVFPNRYIKVLLRFLTV